jgi:hypothetical protein
VKAVSTAASTARHTVVALIEALVILAIVGAIVFGAASLAGIRPAGADSVFAAKGGNGGGNSGANTGGGGGSTGGGGTDSIVVGSPDGTALRTAGYVYGDTVTTYSTLGRDYDFVYASVQCFANATSVTPVAVGQLMYDVWATVKEQTWTSFTSNFATTASNGWTGGGADCTATLLNATWKGGHRVYDALASASFSVSP